MTTVPVEEVRVIAVIGVLKLRNVAPVGGTSITVSERFALLVPPPPPPLLGIPLHELRAMQTIATQKTR